MFASSLPMPLGEQYVLTALLHETPGSLVHVAVQQNLYREVVVETLRPEAVPDLDEQQAFFGRARAKARIPFPWVTSVLELFYAEGTWHLVLEKPEGETLQDWVNAGIKLPGTRMCVLMLHLCHYSIFMDAEGLACDDFELSQVAVTESDFRLCNSACEGNRRRSASQRFLARAAELLLPLLDESESLVMPLRELMERMCHDTNWCTLSPLWYDEAFVSLQASMDA